MTQAGIPRTASADDLKKIAAFNDTAAEFPQLATLGELIAKHPARQPNALALVCGHDISFGRTSLTYGDLGEKVNQLARHLRQTGIRPGHVVALLLERSFAMSIGILAIIQAGAAYLPLSPESPQERNDYMLREASVTTLLVHGRTRHRIAFPGTVINLDDLSLYNGSGAALERLNGPHDLAYVIYTSGSTGRPKGVMITHRAVVNRLHWMQNAYPISSRDVILQKTPYYFDVSVWELFWWAIAGARLCFLPPSAEKNPSLLVRSIREYSVTVLHFVPSMLSVFLEYLESKEDTVTSSLPSVRQVFASGEALSPEHVERFNRIWGRRTGARLTNLYGPTEATVDVTFFDCPPEGQINTVPIGRPIDNTRIYVLRDGQQVAIGEPGELCIAGVGLALGYINADALTKERFTDNPANPGERIYHTGDLARWLPDGNLEYLGREDHQVKIRGLRIELGEIENSIRQAPDVVDCVVAVKTLSEAVVLIVAYVVCRGSLQTNDLKSFLRARLPEYMVPNHFKQIPEIPLTPSGKADRKALPDIGLTRST